MKRKDVIEQVGNLALRANSRGVSTQDVIIALVTTASVIAAKLRGQTYEQGCENAGECIEVLLGHADHEREEPSDPHRN